MISQSEYVICVTQCKELKKSGNQIIEIVQKMLKDTEDLDVSRRRYLNAVQESAYDFINIIENLLRLDRPQWNSVSIGALRNELYMRVSNIVLFTQEFWRINDAQEADLHQIEEGGQNMLRVIQDLCDRKQ